MRRFLVLLMLIGLIWVFSSQTPPAPQYRYVDGELLVQLVPSDHAGKMIAINELVNGFRQVKLELVRPLSERMGIYLFRYTSGRMADDMLLAGIRSSRSVKFAQQNHYIELRENIPDDQFFNEQWNMLNTGQNGGLVGADIDATRAWDYTTGGHSVLGDSIVIAIVDDGFDIDHEDIRYWKNWHEIPGNLIDDDSNGYTDDYDGWNSWSNSGVIIERDHGTHVTGIAAAAGNNDKGVAGVNWDARVLPVVGNATVESIVVDAYAYVLEMRARYNETNGEQGAFIVSTNASFGVNLGQPEDFPIWGAMYDSLGMQGILSAGATANLTINIDSAGDIPTAFPSDHLITVTNTNNDDELYYLAAYGLKTIDLGAPGTQVYSTRQGNAYGLKTGTSMASPHVAGAIALLFSAADSVFMENYRIDPEAYALVIKQYLLNGVDTLPALQGITVTGGRLNIFRSIRLMREPVMEENPMVINLVLQPDSLYDNGFMLSNISDVSYNFNIVYPDTLSWISVGRLSGTLDPGGSVDIPLELNTFGLGYGTYTTFLDINHADSLRYSYPVRIKVDTMGLQYFLEASTDSLEVSKEAGSAEVDISSNASWTVTKTCNWLTVEPLTGSDSGTIVVQYEANDINQERTCRVRITGGGIVWEIYVIQAPGDPYIGATRDTVFLEPYEGSYDTVNILANTLWHASSDETWLLVQPHDGEYDLPLLMRALSPNTNPEERMANVSIVDESGTLTIIITVIQYTSAGVGDHQLPGKVHLYPNPAKDRVRIDLSDIKEQDLTISLFNPVTREISMKKESVKPNSIILETRLMNPGLYFVMIRSGNKYRMEKLIITR